MGRAILVAMSEEERSHMALLAEQENPDDAERIRGGVERALESYERHGFTTSFGNWRREVNGIAVPVVSLDGDRVYGMNVGGPSFLVPPGTLIEECGGNLVEAGKALSRQPRRRRA